MAGDFALTGGVSQALGDLNTMSQTATSQFNLHRAQQLLPFELQAAPIEIENKQSMARLHRAQAIDKEAETREKEALNRVMMDYSRGQTDGVDPNQPFSQQLIGMANAAAKAGAGTSAMALQTRATIQLGHEASAKLANARAKAADFAKAKEAADWTERELRTVTDDVGWDQLKLRYADRYGELPPFAKLPFSMEARNAFADKALSLKEKMDLDFKQQQEKNRSSERRWENEIRGLNAQAKIEGEQRRKAEAEAKAKISGKAVTQPTQQEVSNMIGMIDESFKDKKIDGKNNIARVMAERAKVLLKERPGLRPSEAEKIAFDELKQHINPDPDSILNIVRGAVNREPTVLKVSPGSSAANPIKMQEGQEFKENTYYESPTGKIGIYLGNGQMRVIR